jgi:hypothetical protein
MRLVRYDEAKRAVAAAHRVDEVKAIRDKAQALAAYAKQAKDNDMIAWVTEIKVRAERRAGQLSHDMPKNKGARLHGKNADGTYRRSHDATAEAVPTLAELGVSKDQSSRWQKLATMQIAAAHKTTRRLHRIARSSAAQSKALHVALYCQDALTLLALDRLFALHAEWRSA